MKNEVSRELYQMQRKLYLRNKAVIDHSVLIKEPEFDRYLAKYKRKVASYQSVSSQNDMLSSIMKSDIIYVGDYHTCNQSQRSFLRILKAVIKKTKNFAIGMELIHSDNQKDLDRFLRGTLSEKTFLDRIGFHQQWVFDLWSNFKPIFDFAKYHQIPMFAIDAAGIDSPLNVRDETSGDLVAEYHAKNPAKKLFVFIGDLHIAPCHLPAEVDRALNLLRCACNNTLILYQNSDAIYWDLAKKGIEEQVEVVKINETSFCRMHTPPMIAQQSYINWLEHEEGEIDYADAKSSFIELVNRISKFFGIKLGKEKEDVQVYTCGDLSFLTRLKKKKSFLDRDYKILKQQILASESYFLATEKIVYLANLSENHAAEEAAHFIKSLASGPEFPREIVDAFYANILHEALGFLGSKLINNKRKCLHEIGFEELLAYFQTIHVPNDRRLEYETAHLVSEYLRYEKAGKSLKFTTIFYQDEMLFMAVTHALGYMLGDRMYYALKKGKLKRVEIKEQFYNSWDDEGAPFKVYSRLRKKIKAVRIPKRM